MPAYLEGILVVSSIAGTTSLSDDRLRVLK